MIWGFRLGLSAAPAVRAIDTLHLPPAAARLVVTMDMPTLIYTWRFRAHGVRGLERSVLGFAGMAPAR